MSLLIVQLTNKLSSSQGLLKGTTRLSLKIQSLCSLVNGLCSKVIFLALYWKKELLNLVAAGYYPGLNAKERVGGLTPGHINIKMDYRCMHVDVQTDYR